MTRSVGPLMSGNARGPAGAGCARVVIAALVVATPPLLSGCSADPRTGYSFATTFPAEVASVYVPMFENASFQTGLEADVTEAVVKEIQRTTPMRVVQSESADSRLVGVIRSAELRRLSLDRQTGLVQEMAVEITVDFDWVDARSGKTLTSRRNFTASDTFVPTRTTGERIDIGRTGASQRLARDLVNELRAGW